jgi:hypothetical protein
LRQGVREHGPGHAHRHAPPPRVRPGTVDVTLLATATATLLLLAPTGFPGVGLVPEGAPWPVLAEGWFTDTPP